MGKPKIEMEKVTVELPKAVMDCIRAIDEDPLDYLQYSIIDGFRADIEICTGFWGYQNFFKRYNLAPVFKAMNISYTKPDC